MYTVIIYIWIHPEQAHLNTNRLLLGKITSERVCLHCAWRSFSMQMSWRPAHLPVDTSAISRDVWSDIMMVRWNPNRGHTKHVCLQQLFDKLLQWLKIIPHIVRSYYRCCCINVAITFVYFNCIWDNQHPRPSVHVRMDTSASQSGDRVTKSRNDVTV